MNIDERLEAITMNLELASRDIQDLRESTFELRELTRANAEAIGELRSSIGELRAVALGSASAMDELRELTRANSDGLVESRVQGDAQRERIDLLVESVTNLVAVSRMHEDRLQRLERKTA